MRRSGRGGYILVAVDEDGRQAAKRGPDVSHRDQVYWPDDGLTKRDMLDYYRAVAPALLPHCRGRPVTLRVFPDGIRGSSYYQRDLPDDAPAWFRTADYLPASTGRTVHLPIIDDADALLWLANRGCVEFHLWSASLPDLASPDQAIFDLDPGDRAPFGAVLEAALRLRHDLLRQGLEGYPKTSGGRGLHVYVPLARGPSFEAVRAWVQAVAERLAAAHPALIALAHGATHRGDRITIDAAQNSRGRNTAAPYTVRALPGAPVSTPLTWQEVADGRFHPAAFTLRTVPGRLSRVGNLFAPVARAGQALPTDQ